MEKQTKFPLTIPGVAMGTALLLMVPLIAMQFTDDVDWSVFDFIVMGALLFTTGTAFVTLLRKASNFAHRAGMTAAVGATFLLIWVNLAVGLIGSGPNAANLMYIAVVAVAVAGTALSKFTARGMERAMLASALSIVLVAAIELAAGMQDYPGSSVREIFLINGFFFTLFAVSALLFRNAATYQSKEKSGT